MLRKVLVVEDNALNRKMLCHILQSEYDVLEAGNGEEALVILQKKYKVISAVLLDITMPVMDGYEMLESMRKNASLAPLPVIVTTGLSDKDAELKALSLGANDFVTKPYQPEVILHRLRNTISLRENASIVNAIQMDRLTGLYNREAFFDRAAMLLRENEPGAYIMSCFDIENFKVINDQYGASEGDRILRHIGRVLKAGLNSIGGMGSRISADNFAALYPAGEEETAFVTRMVEQELTPPDAHASVTYTVGRYVVTDLSLSVSAVYDRAYLAKQSIKGRYDVHIAYFSESMREKLIREQEIIGDMDAALAQKQFEVWLQPQINYLTGALIGAEALVRWRQPQRGMIPPDQFISVFEQNGFIYELDKYVWESVCRLLRKWLDEGRNPLPVSVNISRRDIFREDFLRTLTGLLESYRLPVELLRLEITESAFAQSTAQIIAIVRQLIDYGFTVEIDDFGSGYSSLNTLKDVPATVLKLDMRFFEATDDTQRSGNIVQSVVRMAKWLGMSVVAEGVETREQADYLKSIGCIYLQGYLYYKPMPVIEYEALARNAGKEDRLLGLETVGNLDNNAFWDPQSMDTLIFNSYVGGACIFEYHAGVVELLRANDQYAKMVGGENMTVETVLKLGWLEYLSRQDRESLLKTLDGSIQTGEPVTAEYVFQNLPGCPEETWLRMKLRVIATSGDHYLVYCDVDNTTAQRQAERELYETDEQLAFLNDTAHDLLAQPDTEKGLLAVLKKLLSYFGGSRTFIFELNRQHNRISNTYEVCAPGVASVMDGMQNIPLEGFRYWVDTFENRSHVEIQNPEALTDDRAGERDVLLKNGVRTLVAVPLFRDGGIIGCIGVDNPDEQRTRVDRLAALGDYIAVMLTRRDLDAKILSFSDVSETRRLEAQRRELLDNLPCGAGIYQMQDGQLRAVYLNERYRAFLHREIGDLRTAPVLEMVHPDDRQRLQKALNAALKQGGTGSCAARIQDGQGGYVPLRIVGSAMEEQGAKNAIYVTFTPISEQERSFGEMLPVALAAVVGAASDMAFVKDKDHRYVCCSPAFATMLGKGDTSEIVGRTDFDLVTQKEAEMYRRGETELMKNGGSRLCYEETFSNPDGSVRYVTTNKYPLLDSLGDVIGFYGVSRDVTEAHKADTQLRLLADSIPGGLATYALTQDRVNMIYCNDGFCRLFGYTRQEYEALEAKDPLDWVFPQDRPILQMQLENLYHNGEPVSCVYRTRVKGGGFKWIDHKAVATERRRDTMLVNAVLLDVTERQEAMERLRISEEEHRLAVRHSGNVICRFRVADKTVTMTPEMARKLGMKERAEDVPYGQVRNGQIYPDSVNNYIKFYEDILNGNPEGETAFQFLEPRGWRWLEAHSSTIFSEDGKPVSAVISLQDITERLEKETVYKKWQQSLMDKDAGSYTLFRCNLSKDASFDEEEGLLLKARFNESLLTFNERNVAYAAEWVAEEDRARYNATIHSDALLAGYYRGRRTEKLEYREKLPEGGCRWLRVTVDMVEHPSTADVEAYLMFEDIDQAKQAELKTIERAETDPLTGVLNRTAFAASVEHIIRTSGTGDSHVLMMLDIDGFKLVNDVFGHAAGDQALIDTADSMRSVLRRNDLLGRLGGDEFLVFLYNLPNDAVAVKKARQICALVRKSFSMEVQISGSIGIAVCPRDGTDFETLYKKADSALYHVKGSGKDSYAFYQDDMDDESLKLNAEAMLDKDPHELKRRMLIVDDNLLDFEMLSRIFQDEYIVEKATDGQAALVRLRHYGSAISVVLLDLIMPGIGGFTVLEKMQSTPELQTIPVVVVSGDDKRETSLEAIRHGATDFVTKPVDADLLRIRVQSAVSKAENERLRAQNSFLELQSAEVAKYRTVLERTGTVLIEHDWIKGTFAYDPAISAVIAGVWNHRTLWRILLSDMVTDVTTVKKMQELVHAVAEERERMEGGMAVLLKTPDRERRPFQMNVYKLTNAYHLTDKLILTFNALEASSAAE